MASVYFDSSVFLAILTGQPEASEIRALVRELKRGKIRIVTSIVTIQEVSVSCYRMGNPLAIHHAAVNKLARIEGIDRDIALTSAKYEAPILDGTKGASKAEIEADNKRRKWDCFHIATAVIKGCDALYSLDKGMLKRKDQFAIPGIAFLKPEPTGLLLPFEASHEEPTGKQVADTTPDPLPGSPTGSAPGDTAAKAAEEKGKGEEAG